jgi:8-oxo-dGTP pyrophosphatase MutT (NUDIX family)
MAALPTFRFSLAPALSLFPTSREALNAAYPEITDLIVGALIFSPKSLSKEALKTTASQQPRPRLLVLQRASTLPINQYPTKWDFPGGRFETSDNSIFDAVAREIWEETGCHLSRILEFVGINTWVKGPEYGSRKWGKFVFLAEVAELGDTDELDKVPISLADDEHRAYSWVTEEDVGAYDFIGEDQGQMLKEAFRKFERL